MPALSSTRPRGQTLVLFAGICALLAFAAIYLIGFADALRNKTEAQATADAAAYSAAVAEARALNYFAYSNRSIVARFAATLALESYQNYLAYYDETLYRTAQFLDGQGRALGELGGLGLPQCDVWGQSCNRGRCQPVCLRWRFVASCRSRGGAVTAAVSSASGRFAALHDRVHRELQDRVIPTLQLAADGVGEQTDPNALGHLRVAEIVRGFQRDVWLDLTGKDIRIEIERLAQRPPSCPAPGLIQQQTLVARVARSNRSDAVFPAFDSVCGNDSPNDPGYNELLNAVIEEPYWAEVFFDAVLATRSPTWPGARAQGLPVFDEAEAPELQAALQRTRQDFGGLGGDFAFRVDNEGGSHFVFHADPRVSGRQSPPELTAGRSRHRWRPDLDSEVGGYMGITALDRGILFADASFECTRTGDARDVQHLTDVERLQTSSYGEPESHGHSFLKLGEPGDHPPYPMLVGWALQKGLPGGMSSVSATRATTQLDLGGGDCGNSILGCGLWVGFMRYRPSLAGEGLSTRANNMPHAYALLGMPSRLPPLGPWRSGSFRALVEQGTAAGDEDATVHTAWASAAGLAYYHPPRAAADAWEEPPSLFNPFWRAKVQRLTPGNAGSLMAAGRVSGADPEATASFAESATVLAGVSAGGAPNQSLHPFVR